LTSEISFSKYLNCLEIKNDQVGDLFAAEPSFQEPAVPPIRRTTRQASIVCITNHNNKCWKKSPWEKQIC